jgi:hypothetical protein
LAWDYDYDVLVVCLGQYFQDVRFRYGRVTGIPVTRTLFFTCAATPAVSHTVELPSEAAYKESVLDALAADLPGSIHLVSPCLLEHSAAQVALAATNALTLQFLLKGEVVPTALMFDREALQGQAGIDRASELEIPLW